MKIVQCTTVHPRYDTRISIKQCTSLAGELDCDVILLVADGKGNSKENGFRVIDIGKIYGGRFRRVLFGSLGIAAAVLCLKPKVVHFHDPELIFVSMALKLLGIKIIYDVHENVPETIMKRKWLPPWIRKIVSFSMAFVEKNAGKLFDQIVVVTPSIGLRFPKKKTVLVQNYPIKGELPMSSALPYETRPFDFAYVGGITQERSAIEMLLALSRIVSTRNTKLHMAGNCRPPTFKKKLEESAGWPAVVFHGWVDRGKMAEVLGCARAGLVLFHPGPNHNDSQPNKLFEYMSVGLPVIASDFPLWRKIVKGVGCGILVDPQDPEAIAQAMQWILDNPELAKKMGENGKDAVEKIYNWENESKKLISMYQKLLA